MKPPNVETREVNLLDLLREEEKVVGEREYSTIPPSTCLLLKAQYYHLRECVENAFDSAVVCLLDAINRVEGVVTTWSCSGHPEDMEPGYITICHTSDATSRFAALHRLFKCLNIEHLETTCGAMVNREIVGFFPTMRYQFSHLSSLGRDRWLRNVADHVDDLVNLLEGDAREGAKEISSRTS